MASTNFLSLFASPFCKPPVSTGYMCSAICHKYVSCPISFRQTEIIKTSPQPRSTHRHLHPISPSHLRVSEHDSNKVKNSSLPRSQSGHPLHALQTLYSSLAQGPYCTFPPTLESRTGKIAPPLLQPHCYIVCIVWHEYGAHIVRHGAHCW